jgi:polar amino acid transport system substrate-binding protein
MPFKVMLWLFCGLFSAVGMALSPSITFITHDLRPFTYQYEGEFHGFAVDIVREMMRAMDHPQLFKVMPFKRALRDVQTKSHHALFIVARRPERETLVKWVGPLVTSGVYFYQKRGADIAAWDLNAIRTLRSVGVGLGNADHTYLESQGFNNLSPSPTQEKSLELLALGRVDVTPVSELVMPALAAQAGVDISAIERTPVKLYDSTLFLVFSKDVPDEVVTRWQDALDRIKASGQYQVIFNRYIN